MALPIDNQRAFVDIVSEIADILRTSAGLERWIGVATTGSDAALARWLELGRRVSVGIDSATASRSKLHEQRVAAPARKRVKHSIKKKPK